MISSNDLDLASTIQFHRASIITTSLIPACFSYDLSNMAEQDKRNHTKEANEREDLTGHDKGSISGANSTSSTHIATADLQSLPASSPNHDGQHDIVDGTPKPKVLGEINPNSVASISTASSKQTPPSHTKTNANVDLKRVVIAESADERILAENEENDEAEYAGQTNEGPGVGVGSKKKKKKKPKSKRGLVILSVRSDNFMLT